MSEKNIDRHIFEELSEEFAAILGISIMDFFEKHNIEKSEDPLKAYTFISPMMTYIISLSLREGIPLKEVVARFFGTAALYKKDFGVNSKEFLDCICKIIIDLYVSAFEMSKEQVLKEMSRMYDVIKEKIEYKKGRNEKEI